MNLENFSKAEILMFFSVLEGELEARDMVIEALQAQHKDRFIQERYGKYDISDPFLALQRDCDSIHDGNLIDKQPVCTNPLSVLKVVMAQCKKMQDRMLSQLAAAESRHRKVILDLEEERRRHAQDTAEGDDVTYMLEKERERLTQQLEFEKSQVKKVEKEQKRLSTQLEEERSRHKQLTTVLVKECKKASNKTVEEVQKVAELKLKLEKELARNSKLEEELATEKRRALQKEAQMEKQLSELDIEKEQLRAKLNREENQTQALNEEVERLKQVIEELKTVENEASFLASSSLGAGSNNSKSSQGDFPHVEVTNKSDTKSGHGIPSKSSTLIPHLNGHCGTLKCNNDNDQSIDENGTDVPSSNENKPVSPTPDHVVENGTAAVTTGLAPHFTGGHSPSPGNTVSSSAASSVSSSPCSSPVLAKRLIGSATPTTSFQSSYQAGLNQRFHAARFKFQTQVEQDQQTGVLQSPPPRDLSPTTLDSSAAKQLARNTVTQVLSRFTSQTTTLKTTNNSPFGTDYRQLGTSTKTPTSDSSHSPSSNKASSPQSPLIPGIKSPTTSRVDRGNPPPIPPKKPGLAQSPASPPPLGRPSTDGGPSHIGLAAKNESSASNSPQPQRFFNWRETGNQEDVSSKAPLDHGSVVSTEDDTEGAVPVGPVATQLNEPNPAASMKLSAVSTDVCNTTIDLPNTCGMDNSLIAPSNKEIDILLPTSS
ncbi:CTTNBP2 N-terminal like b isoform X2 [Narcine bancroftii]